MNISLFLLCIVLGSMAPWHNGPGESPPLSVVFWNGPGGVVGYESQNGVQKIYTGTVENGIRNVKPSEERKFASSKNGSRYPLPETKTGGVVGTSETDPGEWSESTFEIHRRLIRLGYEDALARYVIDECKDKADNPRHCVITAGFIGKVESQSWKAAYRNNVFGFRKGRFPHTEAAVDAWIRNYRKRWHKTKGPRAFYSPVPGLPETKYCIDEVQKNGTVLPYCPNGYRNAMKAYHVLTK